MNIFKTCIDFLNEHTLFKYIVIGVLISCALFSLLSVPAFIYAFVHFFGYIVSSPFLIFLTLGIIFSVVFYGISKL